MILLKMYNRLDVPMILLLAEIGAHPGLSITELAALTGMNVKAVESKIQILGSGRRNRATSSFGLIAEDFSKFDRRKRDLTLTPAGEQVLEELKNFFLQAEI